MIDYTALKYPPLVPILILFGVLPFVFAIEGSNSIKVKALGGSEVYNINKALLDAMPGNRLLSLEGLAIDGKDGAIEVIGVNADILRIIVQCIGRPFDIEGVLIEARLTPERLADVVRAAEALNLVKIKNVAFQELAGTYSPLHGSEYVQLSSDGHTVTKIGGGNDWSTGLFVGRYGCAVGEKMKVKYTITSTGAERHFLFGFGPFPNAPVFVTTPGSWRPENVLYSAQGGHYDLGPKCCNRFNASEGQLSPANFYVYRGDVAEVEYDNKEGTARFWYNGKLVGVVTNLQRSITMYPTTYIHDAGRSARMEIVSMTKVPANAAQSVRRLWELMN